MSRIPVVRQISWLAVIPQFVALGGLIAVGWFFTKSPNGIIMGAAVYLVYSIGARLLLTQFHRRGMRLFRSEQYEPAVLAFLQSYEFFRRYSWIDRFRAIVLMSPSAISYREMALCNIAFCYTQLGEARKAKKYYRRTLSEFPNSGLATAALKMMESVEQQPSEGEGLT